MEGPGFADLLRHYRRQRRFTQCELAERAGVSANSVSLLERGLTQAPQRATVKLLSMALDLTPEEAAVFASSARRSAYRDEGADAEASAAADASHPSGALPVLPLPLTPVIGREPDVEQLLALLGQPVTRLLTLTGAAGVGKTRLALHLAAVWGESRAYDVVYVDLIPVQEPERVLRTIAQALGVENSGTLPLRETVIRRLRERALLLVLDNFEQVLPAARTVVELLAACPRVQAVVTSRSALNVRGERCYPVAPLALPTAEQMDSLDALRDVPSVGLFLDRACAVAPSFALATLDEGRLVAYICGRLDGLPLAIELAAAQVGHFGLRELHDRLADPTFLGVLEAGPQDLGDHQRTMRSTIAWSYDLLSEPEQQMFRWLGVFVNGATLHALTTVMRIPAETALRQLAALETAHLALREETAGVPRYTQLVTMQAYAREHLHKQGEWDDVRRQHAEHILHVVEGLLDRLPGQLELARARVEADYENVRFALNWALETGDTWLGLRMAGALWRYWFAHSPFPECLSWLERFIAAAGEPTCREEQRALAEAWTGVVAIRHRLDQFERAKEAGETAMALWRVVGDETEIADAMMNLAIPLAALCEYARADELLRASLDIHRAMWHQAGMILCLLNLGVLAYDRNRPYEALEFYEQSLALSREAGETDLARALTWNNVGEVLIVLDRPTDALAIAEPAYRLFVRDHDTFGIATAAFTLARAYWRLSAGIEARKYATEAERHFRTLGNLVQAARAQCVRAGVAFCEDNLSVAYQDLAQALADLTLPTRAAVLPQWLIERVAVHAYRDGHAPRAAQLLGAARQRWDAASVPMDPAERDLGHRTLGALGSALGKVRLNELLREGRALANDEVLDVAWQALGR